MKKNIEHNYIFIIGILIAGGIVAYKGMDFGLWTILWIFFVGLMIFGGIVTLLQKW